MEYSLLQENSLNNGDLMSNKHMTSVLYKADTNECRDKHVSDNDISPQLSDMALPPEECEKLVLSPSPVPLNFETAAVAIYAAACRSSKTHSVSGSTRSLKTNRYEGFSDNSRQSSSNVNFIHVLLFLNAMFLFICLIIKSLNF